LETTSYTGIKLLLKVTIQLQGLNSNSEMDVITARYFDGNLEVFTVIFQVEIFWAVTLCSVVVRYQHFGGPCCLHFQGEDEGSMDR